VNLLLVGPVDTPVREALLSGISHDVAVRESGVSGEDLVDEAISRGAFALVTTTTDAEEMLSLVPRSLLLIGVSGTTPDVLVARDGDSRRLANPSMDVLDQVIREAAAVT